MASHCRPRFAGGACDGSVGEQTLKLPHVTWMEHLTGEWIIGEWEPFISPLLAFGILGTAWWYLLGWSAGRAWMFLSVATFVT